MKKILIITSLCLSVLYGNLYAQNWQLTWSEEFDKNGAPDSSTWDYELGYVRNKELQYYTDNQKNVWVENGICTIEAHKENDTLITSASINTQGKKDFLYGRIEVKAKIPTGLGTWPAIWMMGTNRKEVTWPECGEIDILENVGYDSLHIHANVHTEAYNHTRGTNKGSKIKAAKPWEDFHIYAFEWFEDRMDFYFDDKKYFTFDNDGNKDFATWPFDKPHYLLINLAFGGGWGGAKGVDENILPVKYKIDYVRYYQTEKQIESTKQITPVLPGKLGGEGFWNKYSRRFIYPPVFEAKRVEAAEMYQYIAKTDKGNFEFVAAMPFESLSNIWQNIPVGNVDLVILGLDDEKNVLDTSYKRSFYRASVFSPPYHEESTNYHESAKRVYEYYFNQPFVQKWLSDEKPDTADYGLYCYPSKMNSAVIRGMIKYSQLTEDKNDREKAIKIARAAADDLISISVPEGQPLEFFPPTYLGPIYADMEDKWVGESLADKLMMNMPLVAANAYLDLYEVTKDEKYKTAAVKIADTYLQTQTGKGSWTLFVIKKTGEAIEENSLDPLGVYKMFMRLQNEYKIEKYAEAAEKAYDWFVQNIVKNSNWEAQYEDQLPTEKFKNLSHSHPGSYASRLLDQVDLSDSDKYTAEELIRFCEDQFVVWEKPLPANKWNMPEKDWITPCALEQYGFYVPVNSSAASMIKIYAKAYKKLGKEIYLEKAKALANTAVFVQNENGHAPTYWSKGMLGQEGWMNANMYLAEVLLELAAITKD